MNFNIFRVPTIMGQGMPDGTTKYCWQYRLHKRIEALRKTLAFIIFPPFYKRWISHDINREYNLWLYKAWQKDASGKEKAIRKLQRKNKDLLKEIAKLKGEPHD